MSDQPLNPIVLLPNASQFHLLFSLLKFHYPDLSHQHFLLLLRNQPLNWSPYLHPEPFLLYVCHLVLPKWLFCNSRWILSFPNLKSFPFAFRVNSNCILVPSYLYNFIFHCCQSSGLCTFYCLSLEHCFFLLLLPSSPVHLTYILISV